LLRYVSGFLFQRFSGHGRIVPGAGSYRYGEDLVANAADDLLTVGVAFGIRSTRHRLISNGP
jgi:hypothetical protein